MCKNIPRKGGAALTIALLIVPYLCLAAILQFLARAYRSRFLKARIGNLEVEFDSVVRLGAVKLFYSKHLPLFGLGFQLKNIVLCFNRLQQLLKSICNLLFLNRINQRLFRGF